MKYSTYLIFFSFLTIFSISCMEQEHFTSKEGLLLHSVDRAFNLLKHNKLTLERKKTFSDTIKKLVLNGINPNQDYDFMNPLWYAFASDDEDLTIFLLAHNADPNLYTSPSGQSLLSRLKRPLFEIIDKEKQERYLDLFELNDSRLLLAASKFNNVELTKKVLEYEDINVDIQDAEGNTPLMLAIKNKNIPIIELLLDEDASILEIKNNAGFNAYQIAQQTSNANILNLLQKYITITK